MLKERWEYIRKAAFVGMALVGLVTTGGPVAAQPQLSIDTGKAGHAGEFVVPVDKSQVLRVDQPYVDLLVGNNAIADVLPLTNQSIYVLGKKLGSTSLTVYGEKKKLLAIVDLVVTYDVEGLKSKLHEVLPNEPIDVRFAGNAVVLQGPVSNAEHVSQALAIADRYAPGQVTNMLSVRGSQQVLLEVRFSEIDRNTAKQLGLANDIEFLGSAFTFKALSSFVFPEIGGTITAPTVTGGGALGLGGHPGAWTVNTLLDFLETKGVVRSLAEPNLTVLSGDTASFLAGGEFPVPVPQGTGGGTAITIEFKEFGVGLSFTPTVIGDGLINLAVRPEVSAIDPNPVVPVFVGDKQVPSLTTRRASTTVELRDGQALAIAGLLQGSYNNSVKQWPWLGDIPVIGALFRSSKFQNNETELVIIVTPHLVKPVMAGTLASPTDSFVPPSDHDLFLLGKIEDPASGMKGAGGMSGSYGHIVK
jgi:pilus assembly protein CpaC